MLGASNILFNSKLLNVLKPGVGVSFDVSDKSTTVINAESTPLAANENNILVGDNQNKVVSKTLDNILESKTPNSITITKEPTNKISLSVVPPTVETDSPLFLKIANDAAANKIKIDLEPYVKIYDSAKTYLPGELLYAHGYFWGVSGSGDLEPVVELPTPLLEISSSFVVVNGSVQSCYLNSSLSDFYLVPTATPPKLINHSTLNSINVSLLHFLAGTDLTLPSTRYSPLVLNKMCDHTTSLMISVPAVTAPLRVFRFSGNENIYPLEFNILPARKLELKVGPETHVFPGIVDSPVSILIRASAVNSLLACITIFLDQKKIYNSTIEVNELSAGIGGLLTLGSTQNTAELKIYDFRVYDSALSDQECALQTAISVFKNNIVLSDLNSMAYANYSKDTIQITAGATSAWQTDTNNPALELTSAGVPIPDNSNNAYPLVFSGNSNRYLNNISLDGTALTTPFTIFLNCRVYNASPASGAYSDLFQLTDGTLKILLQIKSEAQTITLKIGSSADPNAREIVVQKGGNNEYGLFLNVQDEVACLAVYDWTSEGCQTAAVALTKKTYTPTEMCLGKKDTASDIAYAVSHISIFPRIFMGGEHAAYATDFSLQNNMPTPGFLI